jgi:hypothetical protein
MFKVLVELYLDMKFWNDKKKETIKNACERDNSKLWNADMRILNEGKIRDYYPKYSFICC